MGSKGTSRRGSANHHAAFTERLARLTRWWWIAIRRPLTVVSALALVAGLVTSMAAPAQAVSPGEVVQPQLDQQVQPNVVPGESALPRSLQTPGGHQVGEAKKAQLPAFAPLAHQVVPARPGGQGLVEVTIPRRGMPGVNASGMSLLLSGPAGTIVTESKDSVDPAKLASSVDKNGNWRCAQTNSDKAISCTYSGDVSSGHTPKPLRANVSVASSVHKAHLHLRARVTWTEDKVAPDHDGKSGTDQVVGTRSHEISTGTGLRVDPALSVTLEGANGNVVRIPTAGDAHARLAHLRGKIQNVAGRSVKAVWSQPDSQTAIQFLQPATRRGTGEQLGQSFVIPADTPDGTTLEFRLDVSSSGQSASATTTLTVRTITAGHFDPQLGSIKNLLQQSTAPKPARQGLPIPATNYKAKISGNGLLHVKAGATAKACKPKKGKRKPAASCKLVRLTFEHARDVKSVEWSVVQGPQSLFAHAKRTARAIKFRAPRKAQLLIIDARAHLTDGAEVLRTKLVQVDPTRRKSAKAGRRKRDLAMTDVTTGLGTRAAPASGSPTTTVCNLKGGSTVSLAAGVSLALAGSFKVPSNCGPSTSISINSASLSVKGLQLGSLKGKVSAAKGIVISSATFAVPQSLQKYLPSSISNFNFTVQSPSNAQVQVPLSPGGGWLATQGTFTLPNALSQLPLVPSSWTAKAPTLMVGSSGLVLDEVFTDAGTGGTIKMTVTLTGTTLGSLNIGVLAHNVVILQTKSGGQLQFSGNGSFTPGTAPSMKFTMACPTADQVNGGCSILQDLTIKSGATLSMTSSGIDLNATVTIGKGSTTYDLAIAGKYVSASNWSLNASIPPGASPWAIGNTGASLKNFTGTISEGPASAGSSTSVLSVAITGEVNNLSAGSVSLTDMSAFIQNTCPANLAASACTTGQVVVGVTATGTASIGGDSVSFNVSVVVDLSNGSFTFDSTSQLSGSVGPSELNITSAQLTLSNAGGGGPTCTATGSTANGGFSLALSATGSFNSSDSVQFDGVINSDGNFCMWASLATYGDSTSGLNATNVTLAYSSYATGTATLTTGLSGSAPMTIGAQTFTLTGSAAAPESLQNSLGSGTFVFSAELNQGLTSFSATLAYTPSAPLYLIGSASSTGSTLAVTSGTITISYNSSGSASGVSITLGATANFYVPPSSGTASNTTTSSASTTPISVSLGLTAGASGFSVSVSADVVGTSEQVCSAEITATVCNAFGSTGLDLDSLGLTGTISPTAIQVSFTANGVDLPTSWTGGILTEYASASLGFNISETQPCVTFGIVPTTTAPAGANVLDIGGSGGITATEVALVIAPFGCTIGSGATAQTIPAGFAFSFNGSIFGDSAQVNVSFSYTSTSIAINANVSLGAFQLAGVSVQNTTLVYDVDTSVPKFDVAFSGGVSVGNGTVGGTVVATGNIDITDSAIDIALTGSGNINLAGINASITGFYFNLNFDNGTINNLDLGANVNFTVLGTSLSGSIGLAYNEGVLTYFHIALGASIDFYVGTVGGAVYVDYCSGNLAPEPTSDNSCTSMPGSQTTFQIYFDGSIELGPCGSHWYDDLCWTKSVSDSIVDTTFATPGYTPPTPGAPGQPTAAATSGTQVTVNWSPPTSGPTATGYVLQQSTDGGNTWTDTSSQPSDLATSVALTGLQYCSELGASGCTSYQFQVAGTDSLGTGTYSPVGAPYIPYFPPPMQAAFNLANPGNVGEYAASNASSYDPNLMWQQASYIGTTNYQPQNAAFNPGTTLMVSTVGAPASNINVTNGGSSASVPPCNADVGMSATYDSTTQTQTAGNSSPTVFSCAVEIVYSTLDTMDPSSLATAETQGSLGGFQVPGSNFPAFATEMSALALTQQLDDYWSTAQFGFAICDPTGDGFYSTVSDCQITGSNMAQDGTLLGSGLNAAEFASPFNQIVDGMQTPLGTLPSAASGNAGLYPTPLYAGQALSAGTTITLPAASTYSLPWDLKIGTDAQQQTLTAGYSGSGNFFSQNFGQAIQTVTTDTTGAFTVTLADNSAATLDAANSNWAQPEAPLSTWFIGGTVIGAGSTIWSPDGKMAMEIGTDAASQTVNVSCTTSTTTTGIASNPCADATVSWPNLPSTSEFLYNAGSAIQQAYVDPTAGALMLQLANGTTVNPYASGVSVQSGSGNSPYLFIEDGARLWSGMNCAPADWYSQCGAVGVSTPQAFSLVNGSNCLNAPSTNNDAQIQATECSGATSQQLYFDDSVFSNAAGGRILLEQSSPTYCLDHQSWNAQVPAGTLVYLYGCDGNAEQLWVMNANGSVENVGATLCLDATIPSTVMLNNCDGSTAQTWTRQSSSNFS